MKIIDEEPKKELPKLEIGDIIRAELEGEPYYFMISNFSKNMNDKLALTQLNSPDAGTITVDGFSIFDAAKIDNYCNDIDELIENLKIYEYTHIKKVELEARVKHEKD